MIFAEKIKDIVFKTKIGKTFRDIAKKNIEDNTPIIGYDAKVTFEESHFPPMPEEEYKRFVRMVEYTYANNRVATLTVDIKENNLNDEEND